MKFLRWRSAPEGAAMADAPRMTAWSGLAERQTTVGGDWHRESAIAAYPGFNSYLEVQGEHMRFVIDAKIEHASEIPKLQQFIECMAGILAIPNPRRPEHEIDEDWAE